jgi:hypothetical protein
VWWWSQLIYMPMHCAMLVGQKKMQRLENSATFWIGCVKIRSAVPLYLFAPRNPNKFNEIQCDRMRLVRSLVGRSVNDLKIALVQTSVNVVDLKRGLCRETGILCPNFYVLVHFILVLKWNVAFVKLRNQNINVLIVVLYSKLRRVIAVLGYVQPIHVCWCDWGKDRKNWYWEWGCILL